MKKLFFTFILCCLTVTHVMADPEEPVGTPIDFSITVSIINPSDHGNQQPRTPVRPPKASLSGHTLYILTSHADYTLQLLSFDGTVVFETFVPSSVNEIQLPSNLTGDYELQLQTRRFIFTGEVEL